MCNKLASVAITCWKSGAARKQDLDIRDAQYYGRVLLTEQLSVVDHNLKTKYAFFAPR